MARPDQDPESVSNSLLKNSRGCFSLPCCFGSPGSSTVGQSSKWWQRIRPSRNRLTDQDPWWTRAFLKIRGWSELVAGPRWKTFIRRFNRNRHHRVDGDGGSQDHRHGQFQYDPLSYALNFDEGKIGDDGFDEDREYGGFRSFSTRYAAATPISGKNIGASGSKQTMVALDSRGKDSSAI